MIADSRPSKLLSLWLVLSPRSVSSSNGLVLHLVWSSLRALMTLKSPKKWKIIPAKVVGSKITRKWMYISRITKKSKTSFPRTEKYRFTNHGKNKSSFTFHAKQKCPFTRHEKSIGDPHSNDHRFYSSGSLKTLSRQCGLSGQGNPFLNLHHELIGQYLCLP